MTACYASTVSRTCWHALDATLAHVCERLCTYWPSHSSTYRNNWPSVDWVQSIHSKTARKPIRIDWGLLARVPIEVCQSQHSNSHEDNQPAQLAAKVKKKTKCAVCVLIGVMGKTTFSKKTCTAPQPEGKKSKTTLNAHWFRQLLDKNDDEYTTQATFCLSHFDAMTHIMRAEPIPNDVKFHIILGQNWMKTQAKYDFFQKHQPISTSFCACWTKNA